jgi:hypothetical protein
VSATENEIEKSIPAKEPTKSSKKGTKKFAKDSKLKNQQLQQPQLPKPQDDLLLDDPKFTLDYNDGDNQSDCHMMMEFFTNAGLEHIDFDSYSNLSKEHSGARGEQTPTRS